MEKISCILVEDEVPAQEVLKSFIAKIDWLDLSGVMSDAFEATEFLRKRDNEDIDLIFLDIQVPGITGIEFLRTLKHAPQVIITTAYSQFAVEAFELDVRDYLIKPFSFERFLKAISRIAPRPDNALIHQFQNIQHESSFAFFNVNKTMVKVSFDDVLYIESMREYIYIHTSSGKIITKMGIGEVERYLGGAFLRIHRSYIVNVKRISAFNAEEVLIENKSLPIGVNYKKIVESTLGIYISRRV